MPGYRDYMGLLRQLMYLVKREVYLGFNRMWNYFYKGIDIHYGVYEIQYKQDTECSKTQDHNDMIAVHEFRNDDLPEPYNEMDDLYQLTQLIAFLTVRIKTFYISTKRPRHIPGTAFDYPLHESRGELLSHSGSGRVCDVVKVTNRQCPCRKCIFSTNPSKVWWVLKVFTATHVVYDKQEAADSTFTLFLDGCGPSSRPRVDLLGSRVIWKHDAGDLCLLETATCDNPLAVELFANIKKFNTHWKSLKEFYDSNRRREQLAIVVSHLHGAYKRISVGRAVDIGVLDNLGYSKYLYNAPTCPGSGGGPVYVLGNDWFETEFVLSGTLLNQTSGDFRNYSCRWY